MSTRGKKRKASEVGSQSMDISSFENEMKRYQYMLENNILTDCTFIVGPDDSKTCEFKAHRVHVARVSPVFQTMLQRGEMSEAQTGDIRIKDVSQHTFQLLLNYIYGQKTETCYQEAQDLAFAADKYEMKELLEDCVRRMNELIEPENIWAAFSTADLLHQKSLKKTCIQVLQRDTLRCITDPGFMNTSEEYVALLLKHNELNVDDEQLLVSTVVHWARHAARERGLSEDDSGVRTVLEPRLLKLFRLPAMLPQQFMLGPGMDSWLTDDEKSIIIKCLLSGDFRNLPQNVSSTAQKRKSVTPFRKHAVKDEEPPEIFICKRNSIGTGSIVSQSNTFCCKFDTWKRYTCVHAMLIFRAKFNCKWLGFQCASRYTVLPSADPTALKRSTEKKFYDENIVANAYTFNHSLSIDDHKLSFGTETFYRRETEYNSSITIMFDERIELVSDNWFAIEVKYRHDGENKKVQAGRYPNPSRAKSVQTHAGVEFIFYTENQDGYHHSQYDGVFESLIFSL